jgi:hypothetical protein
MPDPNPHTGQILRTLRHPLKFRLYLLGNLPSAFFSGLRIRDVDTDHCAVTVPFKWFTKNPFRSTYFACLSMAAEMSTGALAMAHSYRSDPPVSMLVVRTEANYFKKATGPTRFLCTDGPAILAVIGEAITTGEPRTFRARSIGTNPAGEDIAEFFITWSFKVRGSIRARP